MATPQGRRQVPHTRASLEPRTSEFSTLLINYATRGGVTSRFLLASWVQVYNQQRASTDTRLRLLGS